MANVYNIQKNESLKINIASAFRAIGVAISPPSIASGSDLNADGVKIEAIHYSYWTSAGRSPSLRGIQLWVTGVGYSKTIRRVLAKDGQIDLIKLKAKFQELKAMLPQLEKEKAEAREQKQKDWKSVGEAGNARKALHEELTALGLGLCCTYGLDRRRMEEDYYLQLRDLTKNEVKWVGALLVELRSK